MLMNKRAFTIVELLVVIVVIGILAAITIVSYTGLSSKANVSSLQSDLSSAKKQLGLYYVDHGYYPTSINTSVDNCPSPADTKYCLKPSGTNQFNYSINPAGSTSPQAFRLTSTKNSTVYSVTNNTQPAIATTTSSCPTGYIPVPGSGTYGTNDFCVMKYEAKNVGGVATSQAASTPWVSISQTTAISTAAAACTGCHLITEAEWMTIAQNVLSVASNWDNGAGTHAVGTGYIYSGHNDNVPANAVAVTNTADGYSDTGNASPSNQRRTLTLSNGEVIWDLAGNVWEWTSGTMTVGQPTLGMVSWNWNQWTAVSGGSFVVNPYPSGIGINGSNTWDSNKGVGQLYGSDTNLHGYMRSGQYQDGFYAGVLTLSLYGTPDFTDMVVGFRVTR